MSEKVIFLAHVDKQIGFWKPGKHPAWGIAPKGKWVDFVESIRETYPDYRIHFTQNEKIEQLISDRYNQSLKWLQIRSR